jgi:hypothetical protein
VRHEDAWTWEVRCRAGVPAEAANDKEYGWLADVALGLIAGVHHALSGHNNEKSMDAFAILSVLPTVGRWRDVGL